MERFRSLLTGLFLFGAVHWTQALAMPPSRATVLTDKQIVVVGGGPVGLYFSALLLHKDPTVKIRILEKSRRNSGSINAFGLGVSHRMQNRLSDVPGLKEKATSVSAMVESLGIPLVSRNDLCENMASFLEENYRDCACQIDFGESCKRVDFENRKITTSSGELISYDLLIAADGVNSPIRQQLSAEKGLCEEHYIEASNWKTLKMPKQPDLDPGSFKPLQHPSLVGGRVLPRAPEGHMLLLVWDGETGSDNPKGVETDEDLKQMVTEALQDKKSKFSALRKLMGFQVGDSVLKNRTVIFDEEAVQEFVQTRSGRSHHLKVESFHFQDSVALLGDSAHAMNSLLGQGCACGLEGAHVLVDALLNCTSMENALSTYSSEAIPEAHALTELSLISYVLRAGIWTKLVAVPMILFQTVTGKGLIKQIKDVNVPFQQILVENRFVLKLGRRAFKKSRMPFQR